MSLEIEFELSHYDNGYRIRDWFGPNGDEVIRQAEAAETIDAANTILDNAYLGPDVDGVTVNWLITA